MPEAVMQTVIVKNTCTTAEGDEYSETARIPGTLWNKVGGKKSIVEGERGMENWLRLRNPKFGPDLRVTFLREEDTKGSDMMVPPPEVGQRFPSRNDL